MCPARLMTAAIDFSAARAVGCVILPLHGLIARLGLSAIAPCLEKEGPVIPGVTVSSQPILQPVDQQVPVP